jgi:hypothetical protein
MLFQRLAIFSASGFFSVWRYFQRLAFSASGVCVCFVFFLLSGFLYEFVLFFFPLHSVMWSGVESTFVRRYVRAWSVMYVCT